MVRHMGWVVWHESYAEVSWCVEGTFMIADCWTCGLCLCHETYLLVCYCLSLKVPLADSALWLCYLGVIGR